MKYLVFFLLFFLLTGLVSAIGVSPPKYYADYEEGKTESFTFTILGFNEGNNGVSVRVEESEIGALATVSPSEFTFQGRGQRINLTVTYPPYEELSQFGLQRLTVIAEEVPPPGGGLAAVTAVSPVVFVRIPQPGQFGEPTVFDIENTVVGSATTGSFVISNRGTESLENTRAEVRILKGSQELELFTFENIDLAAGEAQSFALDIDSSAYGSGKYDAEVLYFYDEDKKPTSRATFFFVGNVEVILNNYTRSLTLGKINKINLELQSLWGEDLRNVRGTLVVNDQPQSLPVIDFEPFQERYVEAFVEVAEEYLEDTLPATLFLTIEDDEEPIEFEYPLEFAIEEPPKEPINSTMVLLVVVIIIAVGAIGAVIYLLLAPQKKKKR